MFWSRQKWSAIPGCFERHLQRRKENPLFPMHRRKVGREDIIEAQKKDQQDQDRFFAAVKRLGAELESAEDAIPGSTFRDTTYLEKVQNLLEDAAGIGGNILNAVHMLESIEDNIVEHLNHSMPTGAELLQQARSLSITARVPIMAQTKRRDTPVLPEEQIPTLLSEDLEIISFVGHLSRSFPDFEPTEEHIKAHLDAAMRQGFNRDRGEELLRAWRRTEEKEAPNNGFHADSDKAPRL